jgi:hypothetical protein
MTINAMVAGVQAGRINADVFISPNPSVGDSQTRLRGFEMGREKRRFKTMSAKTGQGSEMIIAF